MTCLQLCVLFNFQICRTLPPVFVNILLKVEANPVQNAFSVLLISGHSEFETGLFVQPSLAFNIFARETVAFCTKQEIASISITWNRGKSGDIHTYIHTNLHTSESLK